MKALEILKQEVNQQIEWKTERYEEAQKDLKELGQKLADAETALQMQHLACDITSANSRLVDLENELRSLHQMINMSNYAEEKANE